MKRIILINDYEEEVAGIEGHHPAPSHFDRMIDDDAVVITPDGRITAVFIKNVIDRALQKQAYRSWRTVKGAPDNRPTAVGSRSMRRPRKDGTLSKFIALPGSVTAVLKERRIRQGVLGHVPVTGNRRCRATPLTRSHPELLADNEMLIKSFDRAYAQHLPSIYAVQRSVADKVPHCRLWDTAFTTCFISKQLRSAYHADGNLPGVMSAITPCGNFSGGELVIPRWRIALAFKPGDLVLFDAEQLHGNLTIEGKRVSAVFYCARRFAGCYQAARIT